MKEKASPQQDLDILSTLLTVRRAAAGGPSSIPALIPHLGHGSDHVALEAIQALHGLVPLATLPERWPDDTPVATAPADGIPSWIAALCAGWGEEGDFCALCARHFAGLTDDATRELFLGRMTAFLGAQRRFANCLRSMGQTGAARRFSRKVVEVRRLQFPLQVSLSPTMQCQLGCEYCISAGHPGGQGAEIPLERADCFIRWAKKSGVTRLGLTGGEPTLYRHFEPFLRLVSDAGLEFFMATNGLGGEASTEAVIQAKPLSVTMHLTRETLASPEYLRAYRENARRLIAAGLYVVMRCNISDPAEDVLDYLGTAAALGLREVRTAIPMPNSARYNEFVDVERLAAFRAPLTQFVEEGRRLKIETRLSKPFPPCLLPPEIARTFLVNGSMVATCPVHMVGYTNNMVIYPNLRYSACLGLDAKSTAEVVGFRSPRDAAGAFRQKVHTVMRKPLMPSCASCPLWKGGRCTGGCLSYRLAAGRNADRRGE